jgi:nucleoid DNA-binding protein
LHPKKAKELIPEVAEKTNLPEEIVKQIVSYYWQEVRQALSSLQHSRVHVTNLGDFVVKHWKLEEKIKVFEQFEEKNKQKGLQQITARFRTAEKLFDLKNLQSIIDAEKQRADFVKIYKTTRDESKTKYNKGLEKQKPNSGGCG